MPQALEVNCSCPAATRFELSIHNFNPCAIWSTAQTYYALASDTVVDYSQTVTVQTGQSVGGINFGQRSINSSITGYLYADRNGNQQADAGEPNLVGVTVYIDSNLNHRLDIGERSTLSDSNGNYTLGQCACRHDHRAGCALAWYEVNAPANTETRLFAIRIAGGIGSILEFEPITGAVKNQLASPVGTSISASAGLAFDGNDFVLSRINYQKNLRAQSRHWQRASIASAVGAGYDGPGIRWRQALRAKSCEQYDS